MPHAIQIPPPPLNRPGRFFMFDFLKQNVKEKIMEKEKEKANCMNNLILLHTHSYKHTYLDVDRSSVAFDNIKFREILLHSLPFPVLASFHPFPHLITPFNAFQQ